MNTANTNTTAAATDIAATVYDYKTGDEIGTADAETYARYLADIADDAGPANGEDYGFTGVIYMY